MIMHGVVFITLAILALTVPRSAGADVVTEWNQHTQDAINAENTDARLSQRSLAIVHAAIFDAVNGIERRFTPYHVDFAAPRGASPRAAAIEAAYIALVNLFPSQKATFDRARTASLASTNGDGNKSITRGIEWGQEVAEDILAWRSTDGFDIQVPPYLGSTAPGQWRPTPPDFRPAILPQVAHATPFAMTSPSQFRPAGPPALRSVQYTFDFNEVKAIGSRTSSTRNPEQTEIAKFWDDNAGVHWNLIAVSLAADGQTSLLENARLFVLLNIAMADATIAAWDAKFFYNFWRPVTAIRLADTDRNRSTSPDPTWLPLRSLTPAHSDYPSNHSAISGAAAAVLAAHFGDHVTFTSTSGTLPGVIRTHTSFSAAAEEVNDARVYNGIHFRTACSDGRAMGDTIADYVIANLAQPASERR
jgi:hypothetical protein